MKQILKKLFGFLYVMFALFWVTTPAAIAGMTDAGEEPGAGLSALETILWFVVLPATVWAIVWFLWSIPKWRRLNEPKTGENWNPKPSSEIEVK